MTDSKLRLSWHAKSLSRLDLRHRNPLRLCVRRHPGVKEEPRARTRGKSCREYERGSSHYRVTGACCASRVGFGALVAVTPRTLI